MELIAEHTYPKTGKRVYIKMISGLYSLFTCSKGELPTLVTSLYDYEKALRQYLATIIKEGSNANEK